MAERVDFDAAPDELIRTAYKATEDESTPRNNQCMRDYLNWMAFTDMTGRDGDLVNIHVPKIYSLIENKTPRSTKALFGRRPYLPFEAVRDEFKEVGEIQSVILDELLEKGNFFVEASLADKMKTTYGTAFMNVLPYYDKVIEKKAVEDPVHGYRVIKSEAYRLRLRVETWAPWEVRVAPLSRDLETVDGCRYVIKMQLVSKRMIRLMYEKNMYPDFDIEKLDGYTSGTAKKYFNEHFGKEMLEAVGLSLPQGDDDICVLLRYESPDRYIDSINGQITMRDGSNPWEHGMINLSRFCHIQVPHTTNRFWGMGEAKPAEPQAYLFNDLTNMALNAHMLINQPVAFYRKGSINPDDIIFSLGSRIPVDGGDDDRPISEMFEVHAGQALPREHFEMMDRTERGIDLGSAEFENQRGEVGQSGTTATEMVLAKEGSDGRTELTITLNEKVFLADFGKKSMSIIEQVRNFNDISELVGEEEAYKVFTSNPNDLPGGFNFRFKGSDRVINMLAKQRAHREMLPTAIMSPAAKPAGMIRQAYKLHDFTDEELDEMFLTEEEMQQAVVAQMMMESEARANQAATDQVASKPPTKPGSSPKGGPQKNETAAEAQKTGQTARNATNTGGQTVA